ncbi:enoyl-CoA hydratase/isomerase family protein [Cupriavidus sp. 30B13]|uniref:enoyl-CoA hydratase/isomerase family protein n=1 Tax=Cupriavidus sp. 30B13 TaxID=3384241 RepID=UPI003B8FE6D3
MTATHETYETIETALSDNGTLVVTLNRPQASNATNTQMGREMRDMWARVAAPGSGVHCVILTGAGRAFSAGGDLKERNGMTNEQWQQQHAIFEASRRGLIECPVPVIAAVNGHAYAGGCETVLACDFAYAVRSARFALTEVTLGIMPGSGGTQYLPRVVGQPRAMEIILTGLPFSAEQAREWGMVNELFDDAPSMLQAALATAARIAQNAPLSIRQAKKSIRTGLQLDIRSALQFEVEAYNRLVGTEDRREGVKAFQEKRKPVFTGR